MEVNEAAKLLAYSFVSEIILKRKQKTNNKSDFSKKSKISLEDSADVNFGELEAYYQDVVSIIENTPDVRSSIVESLKKMYREGKDLNKLYPAKVIAGEESLSRILFLNDET